MKKRILGIFFAAALAVVLAACVYEGEGQGHGGGGQTGLFTPGTIRVTIPYSTGNVADSERPRVTATGALAATALTGPESVAALAHAPAYSNTTPMVLDVTFSANAITGISLVSHGESFGTPAGTGGSVTYIQMAYPSVTDQIIFHQSTLAVDTVTGASVTRNALVRGVNEAIIQAGANPATLAPQNLNATTAPAGARFIPGQVNIYVPAGRYVVTNPGALALNVVEVTPAIALELGLVNVNAEGVVSANNNGIQAHGVLHNGLRRQASAAINTRLGITDLNRAVSTAEIYYHGATVSATLADALNWTFGYNLSAGDANPFAGEPVGIWMQIHFGFNSFWIAEAGVAAANGFSGLHRGGHGETMSNGLGLAADFPREAADGVTALGVSNNALGSYFWSQVAHRQINDQQSTHNLDASANATMTATGIRVAVEKAMRAQGANPANVTPNPHLVLSPVAAATAGLTLIPSLTTWNIAPGVNVEIMLDREIIRMIRVTGPTADIAGWDGGNWTSYRNAVLFAYAATYANGGRSVASVQGVPLMEGVAPEIANAIRGAIVSTIYSNNMSGVDQSNRLAAR
jgi:uncharacterized protein with FMN-binding domain